MKLLRTLLVFTLFIGLMFTNQPINSAELDNSKIEITVGDDKKAEYPGGKEAMKKWIMENLRYPKDIKRYGTVHVEFTVKKSGFLTGFTVKKSMDKELNFAAVECLQGMPKWEPAIKDGKKVSSVVVVPIIFIRGHEEVEDRKKANSNG